MFPRGDKANQQILNPFQANTMGFSQPYESYVPGEYLVTLDMAQIALDPATGRTQSAFPFGVNAAFQQILEVFATKSSLEYFAPLHANGFSYRTQQPALPATPALLGLWNRSQISPELLALQWNPGNNPKVAPARAYLQHMVMRFNDPAKGAEALALGSLGSLGIIRIEPMAARHIPVAKADLIREEIPVGSAPKIMPQWWTTGLGLDTWRGRAVPLSGPRIQIAVLDTGCETFHPHLQPTAGLISQPQGNWLDRHGHGTHVCGILLAKEPSSGKNFNLPEGIGPNHFSLCVYKVVADIQTGSGPNSSWTAKVNAQLYISSLDHLIGAQRGGADVRAVNLSLCGAAPYSQITTDPESIKFQTLLSLGVIAVAAAGNRSMGSNVMYPACYKEVLSVGALEAYSPAKTWVNSNQGRAYVDLIDKSQKPVDVLAPGASITSTYVVVTGDQNLEKRVAMAADMSGTSMAAPMVSAAVALRSRALATKTNANIAAQVVQWVSPQSANGPTPLNFINL